MALLTDLGGATFVLAEPPIQDLSFPTASQLGGGAFKYYMPTSVRRKCLKHESYDQIPNIQEHSKYQINWVVYSIYTTVPYAVYRHHEVSAIQACILSYHSVPRASAENFNCRLL